VFEPYDFHLPDAATEPSTAQAIKIKLTFFEELPNEWPKKTVSALQRAGILQSDSNDTFRVTFQLTGGFDAATSEFTQDWQFLDLAGNPLANAQSRALSVLQEEVAYFYLSALRDAGRHFDPKGPYWRPFLKSSNLTAEQRKRIEDALKAVNEDIVASHTSFEIARIKLKQLQDVVPLTTGDIVSIDAVPSRIFDMLSRTQVALGTSTGAKVPLGRHGEGTQSLAVLMLFNAFLEAWPSGSPIVALEEPEAHLHPCAVRALWNVIARLPGQKIISTHSGDLISGAPLYSIRRLRRGPAGVQIHELSTTTLDFRQHRQFSFHVHSMRGELLFARCWLLVEGETEAVLLPEVARHCGFDFEQLGIRCVPYRQSDIEVYLKAANDFGVRWCALTDADGQGQKDIQKVRAHLNGATESDVLVVIPQADIEQHLCVSGFGEIYAKYLTQQTRRTVTASPTEAAYWGQVTSAIRGSRDYSKPAAALEVLLEIQNGSPVPSALERIVRVAVQLAEVG
jgi:putative ATP-dependent endonuclease of OLD family